MIWFEIWSAQSVGPKDESVFNSDNYLAGSASSVLLNVMFTEWKRKCAKTWKGEGGN